MAIGDIAMVMSKSQVSVRVMLFRARGELAEHLTPGVREDAQEQKVEVRGARVRPIAGGVR